MELIYNSVWSCKKPSKSDNCGKVACAWSCRNLIAFSTGYKKIPWQQKDFDGNSKNKVKSYIGDAINIVEPDQPWNIYSFSSGHEDLIQQILWDGTGSRLLTVDQGGCCKVWSMKNHLINDWECQITAKVGDGEKLVCMSWIDTGFKNLFISSVIDEQMQQQQQPSRIPSKHFEDRFRANPSKPPFVDLGYRPRDGCVSVSESGLVCVAEFTPEVQITRICLSHIRCHVAVADMTFTNSGKVIVSSNCGDKCTPVQFYRVEIRSSAMIAKSTTESCQILSVALPSLFPHSRTESDDFPEYEVVNIQFVSKSSGEAVLICTAGPFGCCIRRWELKKEPVRLHEKIRSAHSQNQLLTTFRWTITMTYLDGAHMTNIALAKLPSPTVDVYNVPGLTYPLAALVVSYEDDKIDIISTRSLKSLANCYTRTSSGRAASGVPVTSYDVGKVSHMTFSPCCCCLAVVTSSGDLCIFKFHHVLDGVLCLSLPTKVKQGLVDLLEYCLLTGWEWWDVLMAIHQGTPVETVDFALKHLADDFSHQTPFQRQFLESRYMAIRASLYRCLKDGTGQAIDCYSRQLLMAMKAVFHLISLRMPEGDAEKSNQSQPDSKELSDDAAIIMSLQPLIQWTADFCMFIVLVFTTNYGKETSPGVSITRDKEILGMLREMLELFRSWGQISSSLLPTITPTADKSESLAILSKVLIKIREWVISKHPAEEAEIERVAADAGPLLPSQLFLQSMQSPSLNQGVSGKSSSGQVKPSLYLFGTSPSIHPASPSQGLHPFTSAVLPVTASGEPARNLDCIRKIYMDSFPQGKLKQCTRCNCLSLLQEGCGQERGAMSVWDQRWVKSCVCGGSWRRYTELPSKCNSMNGRKSH